MCVSPQHINDITGTIELEPMLKKSEAIFLQLHGCDDLPDDIQSILGLSDKGANASTPDDDNGGSGALVHRGSTASTPERTLKTSSQANGGLQTQSLHAGGGGNSCNGVNGAVTKAAAPKQLDYSSSHNGATPMSSTPDDSSIEILPDQMDLI